MSLGEICGYLRGYTCICGNNAFTDVGDDASSAPMRSLFPLQTLPSDSQTHQHKLKMGTLEKLYL